MSAIKTKNKIETVLVHFLLKLTPSLLPVGGVIIGIRIHGNKSLYHKSVSAPVQKERTISITAVFPMV